jgi:YhcH/YjgK/YiaL family protein
MKIKNLFNIAIIFLLFSCTNMTKEKPESWSEEQLDQWYNKAEWKQGWTVLADETVNKKEFSVQYFKNKDRWNKAFTFLKTTNLDTIKIGNHDLIGKDLYVAVSEYTTKNDEDARFEAHRIYADIQYVVRGKEKIGVIPLDGLQTLVPYDQAKDITFLNASGGTNRLATPDCFFVFFPGDAHRPSIKVDTSAVVKKVVVKVRIN